VPRWPLLARAASASALLPQVRPEEPQIHRVRGTAHGMLG
jgi:hypothetical protein